jgi:hypothetical protein
MIETAKFRRSIIFLLKFASFDPKYSMIDHKTVKLDAINKIMLKTFMKMKKSNPDAKKKVLTLGDLFVN